MKPRHEKLSLDPKFSFVLQKDVYPYYPTPWHYHPEYELVLVVKSIGKRTVGDHEERFSHGDLVFLGPNLPHSFKNDPVYYKENKALTAEAIVIHFKKEFLGKEFFDLPEMIRVDQFFEKAKFGLKILGKTQQKVTEIMHQMLISTGHRRVIQLLDILEILSLSEELELLANPGFVEQITISDNDRITKVHQYIMANFKSDIPLSDVAESVNMSIPSFCRFFKACTRKNFSHFLNEVRVGYACKLLLKDNQNVSEICYESGFNNVSNFNRQFKKITGKSPLKYKQRDL